MYFTTLLQEARFVFMNPQFEPWTFTLSDSAACLNPTFLLYSDEWRWGRTCTPVRWRTFSSLLTSKRIKVKFEPADYFIEKWRFHFVNPSADRIRPSTNTKARLWRHVLFTGGAAALNDRDSSSTPVTGVHWEPSLTCRENSFYSPTKLQSPPNY